MYQGIRSKLQERREKDISDSLSREIAKLSEEGYRVEFGNIGTKTTYALITNGEDEIVGYTFIKDISFKNDMIGQYKALQQALTRKNMLSEKESI